MKILGTADLHLKNYLRHNLIPNFRLEQYLTLANMMAQTALSEDVGTIIFAGDILDTIDPHPIVYHYLHEFFNILINKTKCNIIIIHGNHDIDSKTMIVKYDTYYPNFNHERVLYLHNESITTLDGCEFYFRGWEPEFKEIPKCDVFVGHGFVDGASTIHGFKVKGSDVKIDPSKCKLAIMGDVHKAQIIGNVFIPGTPIQHSFSDDPDNSIFILDTKLPLVPENIKRIPTGNKFLKFIYSEIESKDPMIITRSPLLSKPTKSIDLNSISKLNIEESLNELIKDFPYLDELKGTFGKYSFDKDVLSSEFKATLQSIKICNFKSIKNLELDFNSTNRLTILVGDNGAGKSTLIESIIWGLTGSLPGDVNDVIRIGEEYCEVNLNISFDNQLIRIERSRGSKFQFRVWVNDCEMLSNNKSDLQVKLNNALPIINRLHMLYFNQSRDGLLSELNDSARVSLISELSGQSITLKLTENVDNKIVELINSSNLINNSYQLLQAKFDGIKSTLVKVEDPSELISAEKELIKSYKSEKLVVDLEITNKIKLLDEEAQSKLQTLTDQVSELRIKSSELESKIKSLEENSSHLKNIANQIPQWICSKCNTIIKSVNFNEELVNKAKLELEDLNLNRSIIVDQINSIKQSIAKKQLLQRGISDELRIAKATSTLDLKVKLNNLDKLISDSDQKLGSYNSQLLQYQTYLDNKSKVEALSIELEASKILVEESQRKLLAFQSIRKLVFGSDGLLSASILDKVANSLNKDEKLRITTNRVLKNGRIKPTLDIDMFIDNIGWIEYKRLSGGQRLYADLYLLSKIIELVGGIGFLFLDETMKYASKSLMDKMFSILELSLVNSILLIHHGSIPQESDCRILTVSLINGESKYEVNNE